MLPQGINFLCMVENNKPTKCYKVDLSKVKDGHEYSDIICYAHNRNEARKTLLKICYWYAVDMSENEFTYLTIPVIRDKELDLVEYNGMYITKAEERQQLLIKERNAELDKILLDPNITHCYIFKNGCAYRDNYCGYTENKTDAGVYLKEYAIKHARGIYDITIRPINKEAHNEYLIGKIAEIKKRIIA